VNPCTGGGIPGAAKGAYWAANAAVEAISRGEHDEAAVWEYNHQVQTDFGRRFAAMDIYNIWGGTHDVRDLVSIISSLPGQQLVDALGTKGTSSMSLGLKIKTIINSFGHWGELKELYDVHTLASDLKAVYNDYPTSPDGFEDWRRDRDALMDDLYDLTGADPKY
jgi:electron-transferring-flavoprotein dehydrogenase